MNEIVGVAILLNGVVYSLPKPNRHHNIMRMMVDVYNLPKPIVGIQGFVLDTGKFVDRNSAYLIAVENGQIYKKEFSDKLYSEDLW